MNAAGASVWGRLISWLDHPEEVDAYARLRRMPAATDDALKLAPFFESGKLNTAKVERAFLEIAPRIRASRILFVPALLSGIALTASRLRLVEYLTHQARQLRDHGFDASIADIDTGASVQRNGERLAEILSAHHCPTWIVTHSKGGLDTLQALIAHTDLQRYVDGWIAFQAPFFGSPVADVASGSIRARRISSAALKMIGADPTVVSDLRTDRRSKYMDDHAARIEALAAAVPVMCVGTVSATGPRDVSLMPSSPTGRWMDQLGLLNDGLVPLSSAILPGSRFVRLRALGHGQVATNHILSRRKFEHIDLLKALLALMVGERAPNKVAA